MFPYRLSFLSPPVCCAGSVCSVEAVDLGLKPTRFSWSNKGGKVPHETHKEFWVIVVGAARM